MTLQPKLITMKFVLEPLVFSLESYGSWVFRALNRLIDIEYSGCGPFSGSFFRFKIWPLRMVWHRAEVIDDKAVRHVDKWRLGLFTLFNRGFFDCSKCERSFHGSPTLGYDKSVSFTSLVKIMLKFKKVT